MFRSVALLCCLSGGLAACGDSPVRGYFSSLEEIRQLACACNESLNGKSACDVKIKEEARTCFEGAYDRSSESDKASYDCGDDMLLEYATCIDAIDGCDTGALADCGPLLENDDTCGDGFIDVTGCPDIEESFE